MGGGPTEQQQPDGGPSSVYNLRGRAVPYSNETLSGPHEWESVFTTNDSPMEISPSAECESSLVLELDEEIRGRTGKAESVSVGTGEPLEVGGNDVQVFKGPWHEGEGTVDTFSSAWKGASSLSKGAWYEEGRQNSPSDGIIVHKLMHVTSDKLDLSFVEKVIIPPDEIEKLCNKISPSSAVFRDGKCLLDFRLLNRTSLKVVGLYGSKEVLVDVFRRLNFSSVVALLKGGKLEVGIYGFQIDEVMYIFYWHQGQKMDEASRKDVSCNFIRYVVDLCGTVYVCLDGQDMKASLQTTADSTASSRKQRTQRLQISVVKESENDLKLSKGFHIYPSKILGEGWLPVADLQGLVPGDLRPRLAGSLHRSAVLTATRCPPRIVEHKQDKKVHIRELPQLVQEWTSTYNLDVMKLPDPELVQFVEYGDVEGRNAYRLLMDSFDSRREGHAQKFWKMGEWLTQEEEKVVTVLRRAREAYLELSHPWEESLVRDASPFMPSDEGSASVEQTNSVNVTADPRSELVNAQIELAKLWTGGSDSSLLFVGSEIQIGSESGKRYKLRGNEDFVIESCSKAVGPVLFGQEFVLRAKGTPSAPSLTCTAHAVEGDCPKAPLLASRCVRLEVKTPSDSVKFFEQLQKTEKLKILSRTLTGNGMYNWMDSCAKLVIPNLDKIVVDLALVAMANPALYGASVSRSVRDLTKFEDALSRFRKKFSESERQSLLKKANQAQPDYSDDSRKACLARLNRSQREELVGTCKIVYGQACSEFATTVVSMVKRDITPMVKQNLEFERSQESTSMEESFQRDCSAFLTDLRIRLSSGKVPGRRTLAVTRCRRESSGWDMKSWILDVVTLKSFSKHNGSERVELHFVTEETESERISWSMAEFTPMKKDLDALLLKETHLIVPECSANYRLIDVDPRFQRLSYVFPVKSGEVLVFVDDDSESAIHLYLLPKLGLGIQASNPIKTFRRGRDLVALDEAVKLAAFYDRNLGKVSILRFDETFRHFEWSGVDIFLSDYAGSRILTSMVFIPGKREILLVDSDLKVRVCEINQPAMMKPRHVSLQCPEHKICITPDGSCLVVFHSTEIPTCDGGEDKVLNVVSEMAVVDDSLEAHPGNVLTLDVYLLDGTMSRLKTLELSDSFSGVSGIDVATVAFGSQSHLILIDTFRPDRGVSSELLEVTSASEVCQLQTLSKSKTNDTGGASRSTEKNVTCPSLEYVHHILDKYATSPPLISGERELCVHIVLGGGPVGKKVQFKGNCTRYLESCVEKLQRDKGKDFSSLKLTFASDYVGSYVVNQTLLESTEVRNCVSMGDWVRLLVSLVPIQIARAENNGLRPLIDGLQISSNLNYADAVGLAEALRFGFYDAVLAQWTGAIKVISSMGKQSSGKSYLLNHLSGSLLDVAGGRCTDGVWMTMRASRGCLYVLLDFEGLGSFERSEQEDMLLSILNAAVSNITIFNKKDFHLDKETEAVFERFQNGVSIVKQDSRLFKGLFYMAIKDVDTSDVEDLKAEFYTKIQQICSKSQDNFLTRMYGGEVEVAAMPPFHRHEYHDSVADIAATVEEIKAIHQSGRSLMVDLKLVIAQISSRDWSPIDTKRIALRLELLKKHFMSAVKLGRLMTDSENMLINFETQEPVPDLPTVVDGHVFSLSDTGLELSPRQESQVMGDILERLRNDFQALHARTGVDDEIWHSTYEKFLMALADRRKERILGWLACNTSDFQDDGDVQKLRLETVVVLAELKERLSLCSSKCKVCFLRCVLEKSHPTGKSFHSCLGSHLCSEICTFCLAENPELETGLQSGCSDLSGHEGPHDCKIKSHTCGQDCSLMEQSSNCNIACALKPAHSGDHKCNTKQHMCGQDCSLSLCKNSCMIPLDTGEHDVHICHERMCPVNCTMDGCNRKCGSEDHFHERSSSIHLCGSEHTCSKTCESQGICEIVTEVVKKSKTFCGKRSVFEYEHVSEQNAVRKACCIAIPSGMETHGGDHCHTVNPNAVHFCETKCPACGYFCNLPIGHPGVHDTTHGNMRDVHFVGESEDIDLVDRKYAWGESGLAEMCMMHCKAQGRGHIHLIKCPHAQTKGACAEGMYEGARHQTQEYGPDKSVAKDEMTHAAYWKRLRFKDPCQEDDQKQFELCNHFCRSDEHVPAASVKNTAQSRSYCVEKLWHAPVARTGSASSTGYVTDDGHSFACDHLRNAANHVVFVIDRSGSMGSSDIQPTLAKFCGRHNNRLGCVFEAIVRFIGTRMAAGQADVVSIILFDNIGSIAVNRQPISEQLVDGLLHSYAGNGTTYSSGLNSAREVLQAGLHDSSMQAKHPAVVFLSDGGNNGGANPLSIIKEMKDLDPRLVFHTILFGKDYVDQDILRKMAAAGGGRYQVSIDEVQLAKSFEGLARSLRPKVASLM